MSLRSVLWFLFMIVLMGCTAVPDAEVSTPVPTRPAIPTPETTAAAATLLPTLVPTTTPPAQTFHDETYGFTFQYPAHWTVATNDNIVSVIKSGTGIALHIRFKPVGDELPITPTGISAGDLVNQGEVLFLGQAVAQNVLVYQGKDKAVLYDNLAELPRRHLIFSLELASNNSDYEVINIPEDIQAEAEAIIASFMMADTTFLPTPAPAPPIAFSQPFWLGRGEIKAAAFLPGGEQVVIGWADGLSLVNTADGTERWQHTADTSVLAVTMHPQGTAVAAALSDGTVLVVDVASGQAQSFVGARPNAYWGDVAWSPDGRTIAFQFIGPNRGDPIYLLHVADGAVSEVPGSKIDEGTWPYLVWSPDGQTLTLPSLGESCSRIVDVTTGETFLSLAHDEGCYEPFAATWSPDGRVLALATGTEIHLLDTTTFDVGHRLSGGPFLYSIIQAGHPIAFSSDGRYLCNKGGFDFYSALYPLKVWDVATAELIGQQGEDGLAADVEGENPHRMAIICDGGSVTSLFRDGRLTSWTPLPAAHETAEVTFNHLPVIAPLHRFVWSGDGRKIAAFNRYGGTIVWDVTSAQVEASFNVGRGMPALSQNGQMLALLDAEQGDIAVYDLETSQPLARLPEATTLPIGGAFSPTGVLLAYGADHRVMLADPLTGAVTAVLEGHPTGSTISRVVWSPDDGGLVTAGVRGEEGELILWERDGQGGYQETMRSETVRAGYECCVVLALFSPSGNLVALEELPHPEAAAFKIHIYERETKEVILTVTEHQLAAWVSDDTLLTAEAQFDTYLTQWYVRTGEKEVGQATDMGGQAYAPNGRFFARQSIGGSNVGRAIEVYFWQSNQWIQRLTHGYDLLQISWSPDGRYLASLAVDGSIRVWPVSYAE